jgi:hypothetical protein
MPSLTDGNPAAAIIAVSLIFLAVASLHHGLPYREDGVSPRSMRGHGFPMEASATAGRWATLRTLFSKGIKPYVRRVASAIALTPNHVAVRPFDLVGGQDQQSSVSFSRLYGRRRSPILKFYGVPPSYVLNTMAHLTG